MKKHLSGVWVGLAGGVLLLGLGLGCSENSSSPPPYTDALTDGKNLDGVKTGDGTSTGGDGIKDGGKRDGWISSQPLCSGKVYACSDGLDNDGDKLIDSADPECVGPCDNDEASFATGIPGDNVDACKQDCFFDGNSGQGDDGCAWNLKCDPKSPGANLAKSCPYDSSFKNCPTTQSAQCLKFCVGLTPNGCDCFGCCQIYTKTGTLTVYLGSGTTCTVATPENCVKCTQSTDCLNACGTCELCLGKTMADLPASCFPAKVDAGPWKYDAKAPPPADSGTQLPTCDSGDPACITTANCAAGLYCVTGCCIKAPS